MYHPIVRLDKEAFMSIANRLRTYLEDNDVPYLHYRHPLAYTAQEVAAAQHVSGREMVKTVILKADNQLLMYVLPAMMQVDLEVLQEQLPFRRIQLASEEEFAAFFPDCQVGAMAPFGNLYNLPVYVDYSLTDNEEIVFNAGTHVDTIRMKYRDFVRLVQPFTMLAAAMPAVN
jgi:Ala-tRNA(Pro) deacylase